MATFEQLKLDFDKKYHDAKEIECFLPVHLTKGKKESMLYKKDGSHNEQYYKWQFLSAYINSGLCGKDFIGVEVNFPKGNKGSSTIKMDAAVFDDASWFTHYMALHTLKDDSKWEELSWLKQHLICAIEFKKEGSKEVKGVFNSQLKAYMNESEKNIVFGILYDEERLYLFRSEMTKEGKQFYRHSDEFNNYSENKVEILYSRTDAYKNIVSLEKMKSYDVYKKVITDYSHRSVNDLSIIDKKDTRTLNDALYQILYVMDKCSLVNQHGYNILIQMLALKIYDEKHNENDLNFYINPSEEYKNNLTDDGIQEFFERIDNIRDKAKSAYIKILGTNYFDKSNVNQVKVVIEIVKQFQNYSLTKSERTNLYQLVFHKFASQFSKVDNAQFITPLDIIDFIVDVVNPKHNESIIDPTVGVADFLSVSYVKSNGKLDDSNLYGMDISEDMVRLATLNMLLNGDGNATIEAQSDSLGSIASKFADDGSIIQLVPESEKRENNKNGNWDNRPDGKKLKKYDIVLTNPPFGEKRAWIPKTESEKAYAKCYELWNDFNQSKIDMGIIFLENAVRILKENGRMAIILSNSIASVESYKKAREWLLKNLRVVALFDLPPNTFAEAGVAPTIIVGYKPSKENLDKLIKDNYKVFVRDIKHIGYEVKTRNKVKCFEPQYKLNPDTFEQEINEDGSSKIDEDFTEVIKDFRIWCNSQEEQVKKLFL